MSFTMYCQTQHVSAWQAADPRLGADQVALDWGLPPPDRISLMSLPVGVSWLSLSVWRSPIISVESQSPLSRLTISASCLPIPGYPKTAGVVARSATVSTGTDPNMVTWCQK